MPASSKSIRYLLVAALTIMPLAIAAADMQQDMNDFFDSVNLVNVTSPGVYEGQSAQYYTGGSLFWRVPQRNYNLANIQWPRARAGCGGIDLFAGGFSFINRAELVNMLRNIGSAAVSYSFMLALRTLTPQIASTIEQLQEWAQRFNLGNINSCEAARGLIGAGLEQAGVQTAACIIERVESQGESWAEARIACGTGGRRSESLNRLAANPNLEHLAQEGNVAWRALMRNDFFRSDLGLAEAVMNLSGTVIAQRQNRNAEDSPLEYRLVPSLLQDQRGELLIRLLLEGSATDSVDVYSCAAPPPGLAANAGGACTSLVQGSLQVPPARALRGRVQQLLRQISANIRSDTPLTTPQQALLENVTLPVHTYLTVRTAFLFNAADLDLDRYATLIARDLLLTYLRDLLGKLSASAASLGSRKDGTVQDFLKQVQVATTRLDGIADTVHRRFSESLEFTREIQRYERAVSTRLAPVLQREAHWTSAGSR